MIGLLQGRVASKGPSGVLIVTGGVGFEVSMSPRGLVEMPGVGNEALVHTHLHSKEDLVALYGFTSVDERDLFRILLGATGVGPKLALAILGAMRPADLRRAILTEDIDALTVVPGIGKRSAQRLVLDLRARMEMPEAEMFAAGSAIAEARAALEGLGYQAAEIRGALEGLPTDGEVEVILRSALQRLGRR